MPGVDVPMQPKIPFTSTPAAAQQRKAVPAAAATTIAVTTAVSASLSAAASTIASNAATAALTIGNAPASAGSLSAGVGVVTMIRHLQMFTLTGHVSSNKSDMFTNLAASLQWVNFQVDLGIIKLPPVDPNLSPNSPTGLRRLLLLDEVLSAQEVSGKCDWTCLICLVPRVLSDFTNVLLFLPL